MATARRVCRRVTGVSRLIIYDSDNPDDIPSGVKAAGYVNGYAHVAWDARGWARFPDAIRISVFAYNAGDALDVENGDATPAQAPGWVKMRLAAGVALPWVYVNRSNQRATEDAMWAGGIPLYKAAMWVATLDGTKAVARYRYPVAAVQYANSTLAGGHYDLSITTAAGDAALGVPDLTSTEHDWLAAIFDATTQGFTAQREMAAQASDTAAIIAELKADVAALKAQIATLSQPTITVPTQITMHIPSVPGDATGTLHS